VNNKKKKKGENESLGNRILSISLKWRRAGPFFYKEQTPWKNKGHIPTNEQIIVDIPYCLEKIKKKKIIYIPSNYQLYYCPS
jgi:hypothetical protein